MDVIILLKKINFYYLFSVILILFFLSILHTYDFIVLYNYFVVFFNFSDKEECLWQKQQSSLAVQEELDGLYH